MLPLDAVPRFVANPCENRDGWATADIPAPRQAVTVSPEDPLSVLISYLATTLELTPGSITSSSSLLSDLHLNSLQVVQLVGSVAVAMGRQPPGIQAALTDATVGDAAELLAALPRVDTVTTVCGAGEWVRAFEQRWEPFQPAPTPAGLVVTVPRQADGGDIAAMLASIAARGARTPGNSP